MRCGRACRVVFVLAAMLYATAGSTALAKPVSTETFARYPELAPNVAFWHDVFAKYTSRRIVLHDPYDLDLIYSVIDVGDIVAKGSSFPRQERAIRERIERESRRLAGLLLRAKRGGPHTAEERAIAGVLARHRGALPAASVLGGRIRGQQGLADELCGAVGRARVWLPAMERILARRGVPAALANLPLVESAFRTGAHSHAGAVGIWQFTRATGRRFLHIDHVVDERRDPLLATEAAAKYLRENYDRLGSWPLAITAYNHGANGIEYAVRKLKTKNLATIVANYRSRYFGFASRNFYAEFLAAMDVMEKARQSCNLTLSPAAVPAQVSMGAYIPLADLAGAAGVSVATLMNLNPALAPDVAAGKLYVPKGYRLNVPAGARARFQQAYARLPARTRHDTQPRYYASHRVRRGQTLSQIARMYRTSVAVLEQHNNIRDPRLLRSGQLLRVPVGSTSRLAEHGKAPSYVVHRVTRGQTLSHIAGLYHVSVASLQRTNGIRDARLLKSGQTIRVPVGARAGYRTYLVRRGQTLSHIARLYRTTVGVLQRFNGISDPRLLRYGQVIRIPM